jgi:hypothetical protein
VDVSVSQGKVGAKHQPCLGDMGSPRSPVSCLNAMETGKWDRQDRVHHFSVPRFCEFPHLDVEHSRCPQKQDCDWLSVSTAGLA